MNAEQIRNTESPLRLTPFEQTQLELLREIAAQLAELNGNRGETAIAPMITVEVDGVHYSEEVARVAIREMILETFGEEIIEGSEIQNVEKDNLTVIKTLETAQRVEKGIINPVHRVANPPAGSVRDGDPRPTK